MKCPRCKEDIVVGNVCPVCGYEFDEDTTGVSSRDLSDKMESLLNSIRAYPEMSLERCLSIHMKWLLPLTAIGFLAIALRSEAGLFWILFIVTAAAAIFKLVFSNKKSKYDAQEEFSNMLNDMDTLFRIAKREYGRSPEMMKIVHEFENQIFRVTETRNAVFRRNSIIALSVSITIIAVMILSVISIYSLIG